MSLTGSEMNTLIIMIALLPEMAKHPTLVSKSVSVLNFYLFIYFFW